jgi:hypothetical protein
MTQREFRTLGLRGLCDACNAPATCRMQGETYSFGVESWRLCEGCVKRIDDPYSEDRCAWCAQRAGRLEPAQRRWEDGPRGRVYWVCPDCAANERADLEAMSVNWAAYLQEGLAAGYGFGDEDQPACWLRGDLHARVLWPTYRGSHRLVPLLKVSLTLPFGGLPAGTRLTLRLNDEPEPSRTLRAIRREWRCVLPGRRIVAADGHLSKAGEILRAGSELWVHSFDPEL